MGKELVFAMLGRGSLPLAQAGELSVKAKGYVCSWSYQMRHLRNLAIQRLKLHL